MFIFFFFSFAENGWTEFGEHDFSGSQTDGPLSPVVCEDAGSGSVDVGWMEIPHLISSQARQVLLVQGPTEYRDPVLYNGSNAVDLWKYCSLEKQKLVITFHGHLNYKAYQSLPVNVLLLNIYFQSYHSLRLNTLYSTIPFVWPLVS